MKRLGRTKERDAVFYTTMSKYKTHTYKGYTIQPWSGPYGNHPDAEPLWYIQTYHQPTGMPWGAENCPTAFTLKEAKEKIRYVLQEVENG